jgi:hypothetical protein
VVFVIFYILVADFNNSNALEAEDLSELMDRLTSGKNYKEGGKCLTQEEKDHITDIVSYFQQFFVHGSRRLT